MLCRRYIRTKFESTSKLTGIIFFTQFKGYNNMFFAFIFPLLEKAFP